MWAKLNMPDSEQLLNKLAFDSGGSVLSGVLLKLIDAKFKGQGQMKNINR